MVTLTDLWQEVAKCSPGVTSSVHIIDAVGWGLLISMVDEGVLARLRTPDVRKFTGYTVENALRVCGPKTLKRASRWIYRDKWGLYRVKQDPNLIGLGPKCYDITWFLGHLGPWTPLFGSLDP